MARKETVVLVSDLTDEEIEPGEGQTVEFGLDGVSYAADLFNDQADELREVLAPYVAVARRVGGRAKRGSAPKASGSGYNRETLKEIREWARREGMTVNDRGRLPGNVVEAWEQARQGSAA